MQMLIANALMQADVEPSSVIEYESDAKTQTILNLFHNDRRGNTSAYSI